MITLKGTKKEIRKQIHNLEEKGLLIKKCISYSKEGDIFTMNFSYEIQFGDWLEVGEKRNKLDTIKLIKNKTNKTIKELSSVLNAKELPYWMLIDRDSQYIHRLEILCDYCNLDFISDKLIF